MDRILNQDTLANIAYVLCGKTVGYLHTNDKICARLVANVVIPEQMTYVEVGERMLVSIITTWVRDSFLTRPLDEDRWIVYSVLFGSKTADSLVTIREDTEVSVTYAAPGVWGIDIPSMKRTKSGIWYNGRVINWCRRMAPLCYHDKPVDKLLRLMYDTYLRFGENAVHYNKEPIYSHEDFVAIYKSVIPDYVDGAQHYMCMLEWVFNNAPDATFKEYSKEHSWDALCDEMHEAWLSHVSEVRL